MVLHALIMDLVTLAFAKKGKEFFKSSLSYGSILIIVVVFVDSLAKTARQILLTARKHLALLEPLVLI